MPRSLLPLLVLLLPAAAAGTVRVCAAQPAARLISWRLPPVEALAAVDRSLGELEQIVDRAGALGCDALALPEDTLGVLHWEMGNKPRLNELLPEAVRRMLTRLGRAAARHKMYLISSSDLSAPDGSYRNMAFLLNRDGAEIGRYQKVHPTTTESDRVRGHEFPVWETPDLGGVGLLICHDIKMPESTRILALAGADIVFLPTLGGAVMGSSPDPKDASLDRAAFRTRAVDNFLYLVVARRGGGAMIISPQGTVLGEAQGRDAIAMADINPFAGREGRDALDSQRDMRARLFRERNPAAYSLLSAPDPPVLRKVPEEVPLAEAISVAARTLTIGEEEFQQADALVRAGKTEEAVRAFRRLRDTYPRTWIDRLARERLARLESKPIK